MLLEPLPGRPPAAAPRGPEGEKVGRGLELLKTPHNLRVPSWGREREQRPGPPGARPGRAGEGGQREQRLIV